MWFEIWAVVTAVTFILLVTGTNHPGGIKPQSWLIMAVIACLPVVNGLVLTYIILSHLLPVVFKKVG